MFIEDIQTIAQVAEVLHSNQKISIGEESKAAILKSYNYIKNKMDSTDAVIYGINTGFGSLCNTTVAHSELQQLQYNLLRSHACGTGDLVPDKIVKLILLLKVKSLSYGYSGVQLETVQLLLDLYNLNILPVIYQQGSLGASGDLAPLSHMSLPLIGEGEVWQNGQIVEALPILKAHNLTPVSLGAKEGLALINGTQFMLAYGIWCQIQADSILNHSSMISACSIESFNARIEPFLPHTHRIRKQNGQIAVAEKIKSLLENSDMIKAEKPRVQDPYSFRCIPQVHGASLDALTYTKGIFENELNAVTDNPNVFPDDDMVISGGNFHGQTLALSLDFAAMALAELASISERRIYKLISGEAGLPPFLANNPGLESGFMIAQYTAAGIVSQNKQLCTPASVDSIVSSNGQEDHVSMGANAATKLYKVMENVQQVLAIEMLLASKAIEYRRPLQSSTVIETYIADFTAVIPTVQGDQYLSPIMRKAKAKIFGE
jgi:histidine ammonia-lyase